MILVTGATGFLGSYIVKLLVESGYSVRALRHRSPLPSWIDASIWNKVEWIQADLLDPIALYDAMEGVEGVIHSAAVVSFSKSGRKEMYAVNVEGTANVVNAAIEQKIKRFVHVSSIAALGRTREAALVTEDKKWEHSPNNTHYAITKHQAEMHVWRGFAEGFGGAIINPSTILGYGNWHSSSNTIFKNIYRGFRWYTSGLNGFVGVEDAARAAVELLFSSIHGKRFIVNAANIPFRDLFNSIAKGFGVAPPSKEASPLVGAIAWRLEAVRSFFTGSKPLLTKETAKVGLSHTAFDGSALLAALPSFTYTSMDTVIKNACEKYREAVEKGTLKA